MKHVALYALAVLLAAASGLFGVWQSADLWLFGRVQALWKPVATEEAFEIVRERHLVWWGIDQQTDIVARLQRAEAGDRRGVGDDVHAEGITINLVHRQRARRSR